MTGKRALGLGVTTVRAITNLTDAATACNQAVSILVNADMVPAHRNVHALSILTNAQAFLDNAVRAITENNRHARKGNYFAE